MPQLVVNMNKINGSAKMKARATTVTLNHFVFWGFVKFLFHNLVQVFEVKVKKRFCVCVFKILSKADVLYATLLYGLKIVRKK